MIVALVPLGALADPREQGAERLADRLFHEATQLEDAGNYAAACPRLEQSNALDPAIGTQFNLADCYEHTGYLAHAFTLFRSVEGIAKAAGKEQRELSARQRADALEARVPRLRLELAPGANVPGLQVRRDDTAIAPEDLHSRLPLDPGTHVVSASAPGHVSWSTSVQATSGTQVNVVIPRLAESAAAPGEAFSGSSRSGSLAMAAPSDQDVAPGTSGTARPVPTLVYLLGVGTVVALGVWAVSGALALWGSPSNQTIQACFGHCSAGDVNEVRSRLLVADVAGAASVVLGGATLALYLGRPSQAAMAAGGAGLTAGVSGRF
jgi:hypothetical protein